MWCMKCNNDLSVCVCPDIDERLASVANSPYLALTFCKACNKHRSRCKCADGPSSEIRTGASINP